MLVKPNLENLLEKVGSRYTLSILAAKRARQLVDGALPLAQSDTGNNVTTACEEIASLRVFSVKGQKEVHIPLRPEILAERLAEKAEEENERLKEAIEETINRNAESERIREENTADSGEKSEESDISTTEKPEEEAEKSEPGQEEQ